MGGKNIKKKISPCLVGEKIGEIFFKKNANNEIFVC